MERAQRGFSIAWGLVAVLLCASIGLVMAGAHYYEQMREQLRQTAENDLKTEARLKSGQLVEWYRNRYQEGIAAMANPLLRRQVRQYLDNPAANTADMISWLRLLQQDGGYRNVDLLDLYGKVLVSTAPLGPGADVGKPTRRTDWEGMRAPAFSDIHACSLGNCVTMSLTVPVLDEQANPPVVKAVLLMRIDPRQEIIPILFTRVLPDSHSETLLLRRNVQGVVMLAGSDNGKNCREPVVLANNKAGALFLKASLEEFGAAEGVGRDGKKILGAYCAVSVIKSWRVFTYKPQEEVYAPLHDWALAVVAAIAGLILLVSLGVGFWWARQQTRYYKNNYLRQRAEQENVRLSEVVGRQEKLLQSTVDALPSHVYLFDRTQRILFASRSGATSLGFDAATMVGKTWSELGVDSELASVFSSGLHEAFISGNTLIREGRYSTVSGLRTFEFILSPVRDSVGDVSTIVCTAHDITDSREMEAKLMQAHDLYRRVLDELPNPIWRAGMDGRISYVNKSWLAFTGVKVANVRGFAWQECVCHNDVERLKTAWETAQREKKPFVLEYRMQYNDGTFHEVLGYCRPFLDQAGVFSGYLGSCYDVADRRQLEERLFQSQKLETIGQLAGGIAHDFNNLLTVINGYAEFALERLQPGDPVWQDVEEIQKAGVRASELTSQLLSFSRKQPMTPQPMYLNLLVGEMEKMLGRLLGENIRLTLSLGAELPMVCADVTHLSQVIMNLVVNARDAMPHGGMIAVQTALVHVTPGEAACNPGAHEGSYVRLSVRDSGVGMDSQTKQHIFEPFFTTKAKGKGTGLGLATIYGIVRQSNGFISFESEVGKGAEFFVWLPAIPDEDIPERKVRVEPVIHQGDETILVVEDEPAVRRLVVSILTNAGYRVLATQNGGEALVLNEKHITDNIHLLITDVVMPFMSGNELAVRLRQLRPDLKIMFISGHVADVLDINDVMWKDACFLSKPFRREEFLATVRRLLDTHLPV